MARKEAIVVFNGCFCPVHAGHVQALEDTRRKIEAGGQFTVVAGYFAVATDGFVRKKVRQMEPWMSAAARTEMCKAVAKDRGWAISAEEFAGWKACGEAMVAKSHCPSTAVFGVRDEAKKGGITKKGEGVTAELSSSSIRAEIDKLGRTSETVESLVARGLLGAAVGECLKRHFSGSSEAAKMLEGEDEEKQAGICAVNEFPPAEADVSAEFARQTGVSPARGTITAAQHREIRAIYDEKTVTVYQAYNDAIAEAAVAANSFRAPMESGLWMPGRMTWIKPSAVWMAYRCGWTTLKDINQARVLALRLSRDRFENLLMKAHLSHSSGTRGRPVVVQWDPEREMDVNASGKQVYTRPLRRVRSIQIGLRGAADELLDPSFVLQITDETSRFKAAAAALEAGLVQEAAEALWPGQQERLLPVSPRLMSVLGMQEQAPQDV